MPDGRDRHGPDRPRAYDLDDITSCRRGAPGARRSLSTAWQIDAYRFDIPLVTHPTDAIVSPDTAVSSAGSAVSVCSTARGCGRGTPTRSRRSTGWWTWPREAADGPRWVRAAGVARGADPAGLLTEAIRTLRDSRRDGRVRVSPQNAAELAPDLLSAGVELLMVQGTIVSAEHVARETTR